MILFDMKFKQEFEVYREIYKPEKIAIQICVFFHKEIENKN